MDNSAQNITNGTQCLARMLEHFPNNLFTKQKRLDGAIVLHITAIIYITGLLIVVTQSYLLGCFRRIAQSFNIADKIAATVLYSTGMSTPILLASVLSTFTLKNSSDTFLISGSCAVNILGFSLCYISTYTISEWYLIVKDKLTFLIVLSILIWISNDGTVRLTDGLPLVAIYLIFLAITCLSNKILQQIQQFTARKRTKLRSENETTPIIYKQPRPRILILGPDEKENSPIVEKYESSLVSGQSENETSPIPRTNAGETFSKVDEKAAINAICKHRALSISNGSENEAVSAAHEYTRLSLSESGEHQSIPIINKQTRFSISGIDKIVFPEKNTKHDADKRYNDSSRLNTDDRYHDKNYYSDTDYDGYTSYGYTTDAWYTSQESLQGTRYTILKTKGPFFFTTEISDYKYGPRSPFSSPDSILQRIVWCMIIPAVCVLYSNIPDCRRPQWKQWWLMTFIMSQLWMGIFSYLIIWLSYIIADTFQIPENLLAFTLLAISLSSPVLVNSIMLNKRGQGHLGFASSIGCSIFNISISLGLPWFVKCVLQHHVVTKSEQSIFVLTGLLIFTVILSAIKLAIRQPNRWIAVICSIFYVTFVTVSILILLGIIKSFKVDPCKLNT